MNKAELTKEIISRSQYNVSNAVVEDVINCFMDIVKGEVADGNKVQLIGFGTFEPAKRSARMGKNPQTGEVINIPECIVPKFKPGKAFKDALK